MKTAIRKKGKGVNTGGHGKRWTGTGTIKKQKKNKVHLE